MRPLHRWKHDEGVRIGAAYGGKSTGSKERGNVYHRAVYKKLSEHFKDRDDVKLLLEPWFRNMDEYRYRSPDSVLRLPAINAAVVIEVKLNWADGRDVKLITEYLPIVRSALELDVVWPLLITKNIRGYKHTPMLGLGSWERAMEWQVGDPTPMMLVI